MENKPVAEQMSIEFNKYFSEIAPKLADKAAQTSAKFYIQFVICNSL